MKTFYTLILACVLLTGCVKSPEERAKTTQFNAEHPVKVCSMPDGRNLYRITVDNPNYDHYVYFFSTNDTTTVSVNYGVSAGKTSRNMTVILDGQEFNLVPVKKD
jgi:hypothetical protein